MTLSSITLAAKESNWRLFMVRRADARFQNLANKVHERDQYQCQFCGFRAHTHQEIVNRDQDYTNNKVSNLATACLFCSQCFFLEAIGRSDFGGGSLIYLPEMSQTELNALCHVLFASMITGNSYSTNAKNIYRNLRLRTQQVEKYLGEGFSNPALLGQMMIDADAINIGDLHNTIAPKIRVLPILSRFTKIMDEWAKTSFTELNFENQ